MKPSLFYELRALQSFNSINARVRDPLKDLLLPTILILTFIQTIENTVAEIVAFEDREFESPTIKHAATEEREGSCGPFLQTLMFTRENVRPTSPPRDPLGLRLLAGNLNFAN